LFVLTPASLSLLLNKPKSEWRIFKLIITENARTDTTERCRLHEFSGFWFQIRKVNLYLKIVSG